MALACALILRLHFHELIPSCRVAWRHQCPLHLVGDPFDAGISNANVVFPKTVVDAVKRGEQFLPLRGWLRATKERSEEHTSELQSLMRSSYAVFCLTNTKTQEYNLT